MTNPYRSPNSADRISTSFPRAWSVLFAVVLLNIVLNAKHAVQNWPELTLLHRFVGITLWLVLPIAAVFVLWRGFAIGRWIIIGLLALRSIVGLVNLWVFVPLIARDPLCLVSELRGDVLETLFYLTATVWLLGSPAVRAMARQRASNGI